jgi:tetratricopeptide (TPR) repeat protein
MGWLGLGNCQEANEELEKISLDFRGHPDVLEVRLEIYSKAAKWNLAAEMAIQLVVLRPKDPQFWISFAYASRRMSGGGIPQAREVLLKAQPLYPKEPLIPYNLACYACQLGDQEDARKWLKMAIELGDGRRIKSMALKDSDLEPLRAEIGEI